MDTNNAPAIPDMRAILDAKRTECAHHEREVARHQEAAEHLAEEISEIEAALRVIGRYAAVGASALPNAAPLVVGEEKPKTKKARIFEIVNSLLAVDSACTTEQIIAEMEKRGVPVAGSTRRDQMVQLSGLLSRSKQEFWIASTRQGWVRKGEAPNEANGNSQLEGFSVQQVPTEGHNLQKGAQDGLGKPAGAASH